MLARTLGFIGCSWSFGFMSIAFARTPFILSSRLLLPGHVLYILKLFVVALTGGRVSNVPPGSLSHVPPFAAPWTPKTWVGGRFILEP